MRVEVEWDLHTHVHRRVCCFGKSRQGEAAQVINEGRGLEGRRAHSRCSASACWLNVKKATARMGQTLSFRLEVWNEWSSSHPGPCLRPHFRVKNISVYILKLKKSRKQEPVLLL